VLKTLFGKHSPIGTTYCTTYCSLMGTRKRWTCARVGSSFARPATCWPSSTLRSRHGPGRTRPRWRPTGPGAEAPLIFLSRAGRALGFLFAGRGGALALPPPRPTAAPRLGLLPSHVCAPLAGCAAALFHSIHSLESKKVGWGPSTVERGSSKKRPLAQQSACVGPCSAVRWFWPRDAFPTVVNREHRSSALALASGVLWRCIFVARGGGRTGLAGMLAVIARKATSMRRPPEAR